MKNHTILIADDDSALLQAMSCRLENEGYTVFTTQDGYQALAIARREEPDLMILDINMPAGSGFSVQQRIQAIDAIADVPLIFITGHEMASLPDEVCQIGSPKLIRKPFETGVLLATIRECLQANNKLKIAS